MAFVTQWLLALSLGASMAAAQVQAQGAAPAFTPKDEQIDDLADGPGRDETLTWMTERHGMPDIQGGDRDLILDYLAAHHPPKAPTRAGGFKNPFAPQ